MKLSFAKLLFIYFVKDKKKYFMKKFIYISILFCLTAIILGAFGAHLLKEILSENKLSSFETGIRYQMFHGITILILSLNKDYFTNKLRVKTIRFQKT